MPQYITNSTCTCNNTRVEKCSVERRGGGGFYYILPPFSLVLDFKFPTMELPTHLKNPVSQILFKCVCFVFPCFKLISQEEIYKCNYRPPSVPFLCTTGGYAIVKPQNPSLVSSPLYWRLLGETQCCLTHLSSLEPVFWAPLCSPAATAGAPLLTASMVAL